MGECEMPRFYDYAQPVARKSHRCCECHAPIEKGEKHFRCWGRWSVGFGDYRQHLLCESACELVRDELNDGECIGFGDLFNFWGEMSAGELRDRGNGPFARLHRLMIRIRWRQRRHRNGERVEPGGGKS